MVADAERSTKTRGYVIDTGAHSSGSQTFPLPSARGRRSIEEHPVNFDPQRRAASAALKDAITALCGFLEQREAALGLRQRRRSASAQAGFKLAVEALACNLTGMLMLGLNRPLAIIRHHGAMWGAARYRSPVFGQHFLDVLALMAHPQMCLIEDVARGYGFPDGRSQRSTIRPLPGLLEHVPENLLEWSAFRRDDDPEVLVLRGSKDPETGQAHQIDYLETVTTRRLRKQIHRINTYLRAAPLILLRDDTAQTDDGQPIDPTRVTVRRIFNNGSWEEGGRLYGAFWETMRRDDRFRLLKIGTQAHPEGEAVANVDYGQLFPRLAYLEAGRLPPGGDLYDITGDGRYRDGWKRLVNALLLTRKRLGNWPEGARDEFPAGMKLGDALSAVRQRHEPIAHLLCCGLGLRLMRTESDMLIETVLKLFGRGVTALPLHDSVLVASGAAADAEETMQAVFANFTGGAEISIKRQFARDNNGLERYGSTNAQRVGP